MPGIWVGSGVGGGRIGVGERERRGGMGWRSWSEGEGRGRESFLDEDFVSDDRMEWDGYREW